MPALIIKDAAGNYLMSINFKHDSLHNFLQIRDKTGSVFSVVEPPHYIAELILPTFSPLDTGIPFDILWSSNGAKRVDYHVEGITANSQVEWDFGDGSFGSGEAVQHTYQQYGIYRPMVTVTDGEIVSRKGITVDITAQIQPLPALPA